MTTYKDLRSRHYALVLAFVTIVCISPALVIGQIDESLNKADRILVRMRPGGSSEQNKKALTLLMRLFESEKIAVVAGTRLTDLSRQQCGRVDNNWIGILLKENPNISGDKIAESSTLTVPPCPFWGRANTVRVSEGRTLSHLLLMNMGTLGKKTLAAVASANGRSLNSLSEIKPEDDVKLPYVNAFSAYRLKQEYQGDPNRVVAALKEIPGYVSAMPQRGMKLIVAASDGDCVYPVDTTEWPFSTEKLRKVLEYNNSKRSRSLRKAVVAVADTGLDVNENRVFLRINDRENPIPNGIDDDENGFIDDIQGANMDHDVTGFPALDPEYRESKHGTHVSGLVLGGLRDDELNKLVKERIEIEELNIVYKEVRSVGMSPPASMFSIPNDLLLDALRYAAQEPAAQIVNLSVEDEQISGLEEALAATPSLVVVAAGNDGVSIDENEKYPAAAKKRDKLMTVAAYDGSGSLAPFSNWGKHNVDLAAPGCQIESILPGGGRGRLNGTSQAAPLVAFTAALLYSEGLTIPQIRNRILLSTEIDHEKLGTCSGVAGHCVGSEGKLDIIKALNVYQDVIVVRKPEGTQAVLSGRINSCIQLDGRCYDVRTKLKRLVHEPDAEQGTVWIKSRDNETYSRPCAIDRTASIKFQETGSQEFQLIPLIEVTDLVPAVF